VLLYGFQNREMSIICKYTRGIIWRCIYSPWHLVVHACFQFVKLWNFGFSKSYVAHCNCGWIGEMHWRGLDRWKVVAMWLARSFRVGREKRMNMWILICLMMTTTVGTTKKALPIIPLETLIGTTLPSSTIHSSKRARIQDWWEP